MSRASVYMSDHAEVGIILDAIPPHRSAAQSPRSRFRNASACTFSARRDQAIVAVQVSTRLHISETLGLRVRPKGSPSGFLFVTDYGTQLHRESWGYQSQRCLAFAWGQGHALPRITLHSLRHLVGTAMAEQGLYHASLMLGHRRYAPRKVLLRVCRLWRVGSEKGST